MLAVRRRLAGTSEGFEAIVVEDEDLLMTAVGAAVTRQVVLCLCRQSTIIHYATLEMGTPEPDGSSCPRLEGTGSNSQSALPSGRPASP